MNSVPHFLIALNIILANGERWYYATMKETEVQSINGIPAQAEDKSYSTNQMQHNEDTLLPITVRQVEHALERGNSWHFETKRKFNETSHPAFKDPLKNHTTDYMTIKPKKDRKRCPKACYIRSNRTKTRFLEVFQVVEFEHVSCTSSSGLDGTCLHEYECQSSGGTGMGFCADGYGTCCVTLLPCDSQSSAAVGWFINPDFPLPSTDRLSCSVALSKASADVTQLRLDFASFELLPPTNGVCQQDQFIISGQNVNNVIPILCGINTGQHVYVEVGEAEGPVYLSIQTDNPENRLYSIKVTQLTSSEDLVAPPGCLQYYKEPDRDFESFNYRDKSDIGIARAPNYLNNLNYAICIERSAGSCSVTYTNAGYMQIVNYDIDGLPVIPPGQAGVEIFNCPSDWLLIAATRLCGDRLNDGAVLQDFARNAPITDNSAGPIVVWFRSDEGYVGRGFRLHYEQNSCTT